MADERFENNPFRDLDASSFKRRGHSGRKAEELVRNARKARREAQAGLSPEDAALFQRAMGGVDRDYAERGVSSKGRKRPVDTRDAQLTGGGSFPMDEQGVLDALSDVRPLDQAGKGGMRKKGARGGRTAVQTIPAPQPAKRPEPAKTAVESFDMAAMLAGADPEDTSFLNAMRSMKDLRPLAQTGRAVSPPVTKPLEAPLTGSALQDFLDGKLEFALNYTDEYMEGHVVGLDQVIMNKLRRGDLSPEASCDLHGLNVMQAFETLRGFFKSSWFNGRRCVIVVPGRGRNSPDGVGILREKLKIWFPQDPFKRVVLAFCTALNHDGGTGSVYVLLRKFKKKGKVYWDRMPADEDLF